MGGKKYHFEALIIAQVYIENLERARLDAVKSDLQGIRREKRLRIQISLSVSVLPNGGSVSELNSKGWGKQKL